MPDFPAVRLCIFDVDGLLIDSEDIYTEIYNNILHEYGKPDLPWSVKARQQSRGQPGTLRILEWAQLPITFTEWTDKVNAQRELFRKSKPLPGVPELLANLAWNTTPPLQIAIASSASRSSFAVKTSHLANITKPFAGHSAVFGSDDIMQGKSRKPSPDIFLLALQHVNDKLTDENGLIMPQECLVFEDSTAGVEAARRAGMRVIWVPHEGLREVCRDREGPVLEGKSEGCDDETGLRETEVRAEGDDNSLWSRNGWGHMVSTLQDFPYSTYGIRLNAR